MYNNAKRLTGNILAAKSIFPIIPSPFEVSDINNIFLDTNTDTLYVSLDARNPSTAIVTGGFAIFKNASTLSGNTTPDRYLAFAAPFYFCLDLTHDVLYTYLYSYGDVFSYPSFSTLNGDVPFSARKRIGVSGNIAGIANDPLHDRLYIGVQDFSDMQSRENGVKLVDNASTQGYSTSETASTISAPLISLPFKMIGGLTSYMSYNSGNDVLYVAFGESIYVLQKASALNAQTTSANATIITPPSGTAIKAFAF